MKKLIKKQKLNNIANVGFFVMLAAVLVITSVGFNNGTTAQLVTLVALGVCLFLCGMFLELISFIYRKYAQTVKEIRMATCWNVDCLTDEIRECHNLEDNQA